MGYRLEITNTKNKKNDERITELSVRELIASVDVISGQLNCVLEEVQKRDDMMLELENDKAALNDIISKLTDDIQEYVCIIEERDKEIEQLKEIIKEQQERIEERDNKIKRMESEAQERYEDNCKLKDKLLDVVNERNELERKLDVICSVIKNEGDDK